MKERNEHHHIVKMKNAFRYYRSKYKTWFLFPLAQPAEVPNYRYLIEFEIIYLMRIKYKNYLFSVSPVVLMDVEDRVDTGLDGDEDRDACDGDDDGDDDYDGYLTQMKTLIRSDHSHDVVSLNGEVEM